MEESLTPRLASRIRALRHEMGLSLDALATRSGVSRAMISLVERGESSPTAAVLDKLARGLGTHLAAFFEDAPPKSSDEPPSPLVRQPDQACWRDPETGYLRRALSPPAAAGALHLTEVTLPPGARATFDNGPGGERHHQQVWLLEGLLEIRADDTLHALLPGDCLAMGLALPTTFHNPGHLAARYLVAVVAVATVDAPPPRAGGRRA